MKQLQNKKLVIVTSIFIGIFLLSLSSFILVQSYQKKQHSLIKYEFRDDKEPLKNIFPDISTIEDCYWEYVEFYSPLIGLLGRTPNELTGYIVLDQQNFIKIKTKYKWVQKDSKWKPSLALGPIVKNAPLWTESEDYDYFRGYVGSSYLDLNNRILYFYLSSN